MNREIKRWKIAFLSAIVVLVFGISGIARAGVQTANGWYEEEEIYYILGGIEHNIPERAFNQIYFIGDDRLHQANVVLIIPGERGYTPHWNVNVVHTKPGKTVQDIIDAGFASARFGNGVLFDDAEDIIDAWAANLVEIDQPGVVVRCPIISEKGAESPGNEELPENFITLQPGDEF